METVAISSIHCPRAAPALHVLEPRSPLSLFISPSLPRSADLRAPQAAQVTSAEFWGPNSTIFPGLRLLLPSDPVVDLSLEASHPILGHPSTLQAVRHGVFVWEFEIFKRLSHNPRATCCLIVGGK